MSEVTCLLRQRRAHIGWLLDGNPHLDTLLGRGSVDLGGVPWVHDRCSSRSLVDDEIHPVVRTGLDRNDLD